MNYARARAYNLAQGHTVADLALIAAALRLPVADLAEWSTSTLDAVALWQKAHKLTADGGVGPQTLGAMRAAAAPPQVPVPQWAHEIAQLPQACVGIDVSFWQPTIDAPQIKRDGVRFALLRQTEATSTDKRLGAHYEALLSAGVAVGGYHLPHQMTGTWEAMTPRAIRDQAAHAAVVAKRYPSTGGAPQCMDLEPDRSDRSKPPRFFTSLVSAKGRKFAAGWVRDWLDAFEGATGEESAVYYSPALASAGGDELEEVIGDRLRWLAWYLSAPMWVPPAIQKLTRWDIWQCRADDNEKTPTIDESGRCRGVMRGRKACDINLVNPASRLWRTLMGDSPR